MIDMINSLTIQETIIIVGLFVGLLISLGIAFIDASLSKLKHPRDVLYAVSFHVLFQWICAIAIVAYLTLIVIFIKFIIYLVSLV
tara:strand:+ start:239 stop:493 length:255 start_codon:yes stop_codon:yes gene_type:complete